MDDYAIGSRALIFTRHDANPVRATRVDCDGLAHWQEVHGLLRHDSEVSRVIAEKPRRFCRVADHVAFGRKAPVLHSC